MNRWPVLLMISIILSPALAACESTDNQWEEYLLTNYGAASNLYKFKVELANHWQAEIWERGGNRMIIFYNGAYHGGASRLMRIMVPAEKISLNLAVAGEKGQTLSVTTYQSHTYQTKDEQPTQFWIALSANVAVADEAQYKYWKEFISRGQNKQ